MPDEPIRSGEFNQAMLGIRELLESSMKDVRKDITSLGNQVSQMNNLHSKYLADKTEDAYRAGQYAQKIVTLQERVDDLEASKKAEEAARKQTRYQAQFSLIIAVAAVIIPIIINQCSK